MSQNKKKFFGKHKDEQEQDLEQTQPLPSMPENTADKTVQTEENTAPEEASEKTDADEKNEKAEQFTESFRKIFNQSKCVRVIIAAGLIILLLAQYRHGGHNSDDCSRYLWRYWHLYRGQR